MKANSMNVQKSFEAHDVGTLYLVGTPIGNLEDITYRAVNVLRQVDEIAAEDTRRTKKLLAHYDIVAPLSSYHEHNQQSAGPKLIEKLVSGRSVALVSDAGLPAVSDPGAELVREAINAGIPVVPVPGANAALAALIASGLDTAAFHFYGFLPRTARKLRERLAQLRAREGTLIFYEAPHRLVKTLNAMREAWGNRHIVLARELTKKHEEFARGTLDEMLEWLREHPPRGEYCLLVEGTPHSASPFAVSGGEQPWWQELTVEEHVETYVSRGEDPKTAMKKTALDRGISRRDVYSVLHRK